MSDHEHRLKISGALGGLSGAIASAREHGLHVTVAANDGDITDVSIVSWEQRAEKAEHMLRLISQFIGDPEALADSLKTAIEGAR